MEKNENISNATRRPYKKKLWDQRPELTFTKILRAEREEEKPWMSFVWTTRSFSQIYIFFSKFPGSNNFQHFIMLHHRTKISFLSTRLWIFFSFLGP